MVAATEHATDSCSPSLLALSCAQITDCSYLGGVPKPDPDRTAYERYKLERLELEQTSPQMRKPTAKNASGGRGSTRGRMVRGKFITLL